MTNANYCFDWADLAFKSKSQVNKLDAIFIAAPRQLSDKRLKQLAREYLPKGNIVLGIAKEPYVAGFDGQPQFKTLSLNDVQVLINKVNSQTNNKIYIIEYAQADFRYLIGKLDFKKIILVNGSWKYAFHTQPPFYEISRRRINYKMVSPFADEQEAKDFAKSAEKECSRNFKLPKTGSRLTELGMLESAKTISKYSFDYSFQTGVSLGKKSKDGSYLYLSGTYNKVVPYQTYAMHHGATREKYFSPPHDLNHYDTVHAEVAMVIKAQTEGFDLSETSLFINLLPCPPCSRMLGETSIKELVYVEDHSDGYAVMMLEAAGKKVRRLAVQESNKE